MINPNEWEKFKVGPLHTDPKWINLDCSPLETVSHVAHIHSACDIVRDNMLHAGLVFDKSKLNDKRILVNWLSPNDWIEGFRYGNIRFGFNFDKLVCGKKYYWVENRAYGKPACRILITDLDRSSELSPYDPKAGDGPWLFDGTNGKHYWNGKYCLEFMVEGDLKIQESVETSFVNHHEKMCSQDLERCPHRTARANEAGAKFIALIAGKYLSTENLKLVLKKEKKPATASQQLIDAVAYINNDLSWNTTGIITSHSPAAPALARAILCAYGNGDVNGVRSLCELFGDNYILKNAILDLMAKTFGLPDTASLEGPQETKKRAK